MRRYQDRVEVRRGQDGPDQFLWRGRLWKVRAVLAHWVETGPWWQSASVRAVLAGEENSGPDEEPELQPLGELLTERELWRVEAGRGPEPDGGGVFELCFDWADGCWQLVGCHD